jgi:hypothetical protein
MEASLVQLFIDRWKNSGAAERANHQLFLSELCDVLGVPRSGQWFPEGFVPEIFELLLATWEKMKLGREVCLEPRITNLYCRAIEEEYTRQGKVRFAPATSLSLCS